jgi:hypothetical protein
MASLDSEDVGERANLYAVFYPLRAVVAVHLVVATVGGDGGGEDAEDEEVADLVEHFGCVVVGVGLFGG